MKVERRKLFSSSISPRRKLFSGGVTQAEYKKIQCRDCGYIMDTLATTTNFLCPKCGAVNRFNVLEVTPSPENTPEAVQVEVSKIEEVEKGFSRRSLFGGDNNAAVQKEFSEPSNEFEVKLKEFSGKTLNESEVVKAFGISAEDLVEKGFASIDEDNKVTIPETAFLQSKLFSKLIVSVTKILDLDPIEGPKEDIINMLESKGSLGPKGIMLIKKLILFHLKK